MKFLFLILCCAYSTSQAQCKFDELIPFDFGITKFSASERGQELDLSHPEYRSYQMSSGWKREKYMKNDSVYFSQLVLDLERNSCFVGVESSFDLNFADDRLYKIVLTLRFGRTEYSRMQEELKNLVEILKTKYPNVEKYVETDKKTKEQLSSGYKLGLKSNLNPAKPNFATITYRPVFVSSGDPNRSSNEVDFYRVEIILVDLRGTKYTVEGYD